MSITTTSTKDSYTGNNSTSTPYPITFKYLEDSHITVYVDGVALSNSYYTLTGDGSLGTGQFTTALAYAGTQEVVVVLDVPFDQPVELLETGVLSSSTLEEAYDRLNMQIRRVWRKAGNALTFSTDEGGSSTGTADTVVGFDADGNIVEIPRTVFASGSSVTTSDTPPALPIAGDLWLDSTTTQLFVYYNDGSSSQWVTVTTGTASTDSATLTYTPDGTGAVATTVEEKLRESVSVKDFGAVGDGVTDDTVAIQAAISHAVSEGIELHWSSGDYLTTSNLTSLHSVRHNGDGVIKRGSDSFYISPSDSETNIFYVAEGGTSGNDGITSSEPTTVASVVTTLKTFDTQTSDGVWRIQFASGTYTGDGVTMEELPFFKNPLEVFGSSVDETLSTLPTTVWNGSTPTQAYAMRADESSYPTASINIFVKNIKFTNWSSGAMVFWGDGNSKFHNIHTDACPIGIWCRRHYVKVWYGKFENCTTYGVGVQYHGTLNCGTLSGGGAEFVNCADGVTVGRFSVGYVQGNTFTNCAQPVDVEWVSRCRVQKNTWDQGSATGQLVQLSGNSLFTDDNGAGNPNVFPTLTEKKPYVYSQSGSVNPLISKLSQKTLHTYAGNQLRLIDGGTGDQNCTTLFNVTTTSKIVLADGSYGGGDFVPLRVPAYAFYSPTFSIEMEIGITLSANAGGTLAFHGQGSATATKLTEIAIPAEAVFRRGRMKLKIDNTPNSTTARYEWHFPATGLYSEGATSTLNNTLIRDSSDDELVYRLYWQSDTTDQVSFYNLKTYVTE